MNSRPLGQFPDWANTSGIVSAPGVGFTPGTEDPALANYAIRQFIRKWIIVRDAYEVMNWTRSKTVPALQQAIGADCFSYDPIRRLWFFGGLHTIAPGLGSLSYSYDGGNTWGVVSNVVLPFHHASDPNAYYQQACSDDGRYFTWLQSGSSVLASYPYLNSNAGLAGWVVSTNFPGGIITHAFWAEPDNRFLVCGIGGGGHGTVWSVDVDSDTWDVLTLPGTSLPVVSFGAASPGDRIVATTSLLWRTGSVSSAFYPVTVPWLTLTALVWCPDSFVFVAIADSKLWASPNGVVWSQVITGFEALGTFGGAVNGLGDAIVATFRREVHDDITADTLLVGTNALRDWSIIQAPETRSDGTYPTFGIYRVGDRLAMLNNATNCAIRRSMGV